MDFETLIQQPEARRDAAWEHQFLDGLLQSKVAVVQEEPRTGPDGWPYLLIKTGEEAGEPFHRVVKWLGSRGIGAAVNTHKMVPDYVFTYGMIWNYLQNGRFVVPEAPRPAGPIDLQPGERLVMGEPTPRYLPSYVRDVIRQFLNAQGFAHPRILVISSPDYKQIDLAFSLEALGGLAPADQKALGEALAWFLPLHYNLAFMSEAGLPPFVAL